MNSIGMYVMQEEQTRQDSQTLLARAAGRLYRKICVRARLADLGRKLTGQNAGELLQLPKKSARTVYRGLKDVTLGQIRGSENRVADFDCAFRPLKPANAARWQNVAQAYLSDRTLPPVELIQDGEIFYVRDGHHRVSVARALGQISIEAVVYGLE
jgi:hypothetical protein